MCRDRGTSVAGYVYRCAGTEAHQSQATFICVQGQRHISRRVSLYVCRDRGTSVAGYVYMCAGTETHQSQGKFIDVQGQRLRLVAG